MRSELPLKRGLCQQRPDKSTTPMTCRMHEKAAGHNKGTGTAITWASAEHPSCEVANKSLSLSWLAADRRSRRHQANNNTNDMSVCHVDEDGERNQDAAGGLIFTVVVGQPRV